jgi:hypothetical protein
MKKAEELLFEELFNDRPLFNTQQELVTKLLDSKESAFHIVKESEEYQLRANRLKTYVSQLLSDNISRTLTPLFRRSLEKLIEARLANSAFNYAEVTQNIISALNEKNKPSNKRAIISYHNPKKDLIDDIVNANYVLVITSRPFDISDSDSKFSFQQFLIQDLFISLANPEKPMKYYRFNFPLKSLCELFWLALRKMLEKSLASKMSSKDFIELLYLKSLITEAIYNTTKKKEEITDDDVSFVTNELINYLNKNKYVHVFLVDSPIFSVPMIVTNPNNLKNSRAYVVLENESTNTQIIKLPVEEVLTWKLFVYDRMKTQSSGEQIDYIPSFR